MDDLINMDDSNIKALEPKELTPETALSADDLNILTEKLYRWTTANNTIPTLGNLAERLRNDEDLQKELNLNLKQITGSKLKLLIINSNGEEIIDDLKEIEEDCVKQLGYSNKVASIIDKTLEDGEDKFIAHFVEDIKTRDLMTKFKEACEVQGVDVLTPDEVQDMLNNISKEYYNQEITLKKKITKDV